ncbi:hypothetical protein EJ05DRAFT_473522 [Pseudovirgaria hyperparasitica]|uniref:Uncharacterized protein n=1 Tax=Pseudovirgaria hyperparasitica TaxID=470096 RepID=A0A6A6WH24_9PEZI|nr:uncharacterized protein EJ05DRAFT_473522 [Pseudovirgaria hyperparasitica]KAF2760947.1 hypothetical protein EJ05DRAFT_473522 [Pseudovirgaria hyperparasitica]
MTPSATTAISYLLWAYLKGAHGYQAYISSRILRSSYVAIMNLRVHEKETEKAAKYSETVADQLRKIRTTQASGVVTGLISLISSVYLIYSGTTANSLSLSSPQLLLSIANISFSAAASRYIAGFWAHSTRVPFVESYNEALRRTDDVVSALQSSAAAWLLSLPVSSRVGNGCTGVRILLFRFMDSSC